MASALITRSTSLCRRIESTSSTGALLTFEFGGKLLDDNHASRILPGFAPDASSDASAATTRQRLSCHQRKRH